MFLFVCFLVSSKSHRPNSTFLSYRVKTGLAGPRTALPLSTSPALGSRVLRSRLLHHRQVGEVRISQRVPHTTRAGGVSSLQTQALRQGRTYTPTATAGTSTDCTRGRPLGLAGPRFPPPPRPRCPEPAHPDGGCHGVCSGSGNTATSCFLVAAMTNPALTSLSNRRAPSRRGCVSVSITGTSWHPTL